MFHDIRSLTRGTVNGFYHHHRPAFPRRDVHDTAAPLVRIYQGGSRKSTNLGHYRLAHEHKWHSKALWVQR